MNIAVAVLCGLLFGIGLTISDMINPARVLAFLDVAGKWDPALAVVMVGALIPSSLAYLATRRMPHPVVSGAFHIPRLRTVDRRLIGGAALFGVGWGLVGLCPGPAIAALTTAQWQAFVFAIAMAAGMAIYAFTLDRSQPAPEAVTGGIAPRS